MRLKISKPTLMEVAIASPKIFSELVKITSAFDKSITIHNVHVGNSPYLVDIFSDGSISLKRGGFRRKKAWFYKIKSSEELAKMFELLRAGGVGIINMKTLVEDLGMPQYAPMMTRKKSSKDIELHKIKFREIDYLVELGNNKNDLSLYKFRPTGIQIFPYKKNSDLISSIKTLKMMGINITNEKELSKKLKIPLTSLYVVPRNWKPRINDQVKITPEFASMYGRYASKQGIITEVGRGYIRVRFEGMPIQESISLPKTAVGPALKKSPIFKKGNNPADKSVKKADVQYLFKKKYSPYKKSSLKSVLKNIESGSAAADYGKIILKMKEKKSLSSKARKLKSALDAIFSSHVRHNKNVLKADSAINSYLSNKTSYVNILKFDKLFGNLKEYVTISKKSRKEFSTILKQLKKELGA